MGKILKRKGIFIVALDDHKKYAANLVFTNKPETERKYPNAFHNIGIWVQVFNPRQGKGVPIKKTSP